MAKLERCERCGGEFQNLGSHRRFCKGTGSADKDVTDLLNKPAETIQEEKIPEKDDKVLNAIGNLTSLVKNLAERVEGVEKKEMDRIPEIKEEPIYTREKDETYPSKRQPTQYTKIVHEILSPDFEFDIEDIDPHNFQFTVYVPNKYSSLTDADKEAGVKDVRSRIIPVALGENGVRDWCKLIRTNLSKYFTASGTQSPFTQ